MDGSDPLDAISGSTTKYRFPVEYCISMWFDDQAHPFDP